MMKLDARSITDFVLSTCTPLEMSLAMPPAYVTYVQEVPDRAHVECVLRRTLAVELARRIADDIVHAPVQREPVTDLDRARADQAARRMGLIVRRKK